MKPKSTLRHFLALAGSSLLAMASSQAATRTWGGGDLDWTNTSTSGWNGSVPTTSATINSGTVTVTTNISVANTPGTINVNSGMLVISTGKLVGGSWSPSKTLTIGSGATLRLNSWGWDVAGSLGGLDYGRDRLVVNGGIIEVTGNSSESGRIFTVGTGGATLRSSVNSGQTWTLQRDSNSLYHDIQVNSGRTLTLDGTGNGVIENTIVNTSGTGNITKAGAGTWTLTNANTYSGGTNVTEGTLLINSTTGSGTGSGNVTVANGGTLGGSGIISGNVTTQNGGTFAAGTSIESLATGALNQEAGSTFAYEANNDAAASAAGDLTAVTGNLTFDLTNAAILTLTELGSGSWAANEKLTLISYTGIWNGGLLKYLGNNVTDDSSIVFSGYNWTFNYNDTVPGTNFTSDLTGGSFVTMTAVSAIPEPSAALLGGLGLMFLLRRRR